MNEEQEVKYLQSTIEKQEKIIASFEAANSFYRVLSRSPLLGGATRRLKDVLRSQKASGTSVYVDIKSENPEIIAVVSPYYRGVRSATKEMVADVFEVSEIYTRGKAAQIARDILKYSPKKVLLSGYPKGFELLAE